MSVSPILTEGSGALDPARERARPKRKLPTAEPLTLHMPKRLREATSQHHQAELFYLQKQIHAQTPMVIVLDDGAQIQGVIEWYDSHSLKVRGRTRTLIFKSAIKYMYKVGDSGRQS